MSVVDFPGDPVAFRASAIRALRRAAGPTLYTASLTRLTAETLARAGQSVTPPGRAKAFDIYSGYGLVRLCGAILPDDLAAFRASPAMALLLPAAVQSLGQDDDGAGALSGMVPGDIAGLVERVLGGWAVTVAAHPGLVAARELAPELAPALDALRAEARLAREAMAVATREAYMKAIDHFGCQEQLAAYGLPLQLALVPPYSMQSLWWPPVGANTPA